MIQHPVSSRSEAVLRNVGSAKHKWCEAIGAGGLNDRQLPIFDFVLYQVRRHIPPAEPCEQHRFFGTKIGQAPSSTGKHAPIFPSRQCRGVRQDQLNMLVEHVGFDDALFGREGMGWRDHWPESHGGDRIKFERGKFSYVARQQSDGACPVSHQVSGGTQ